MAEQQEKQKVINESGFCMFEFNVCKISGCGFELL
jgi:hypothetical protein